VEAVNVEQALSLARKPNGDHPSSSTLEAQVLLARILNRPRAVILAHPEMELSPDQEQRYRHELADIRAGVPLPYVTGWQEFYGRRFEVSRDTLIPRPETEGLIEQALMKLRRVETPRVADVGTGSGCIAVTLACEGKPAMILASDCSYAALRVASRNARMHGVLEQVTLLQADLLTPIHGRFDLICANLPYIPRERLTDLAVARHEPTLALDGGREGLETTVRFIRQLLGLLVENGTALLEIDHGQGQALQSIAAEALPGWGAGVKCDPAGLERLLIIERSGG
jgi:release factor glutamine methyltransferase